MKKKTLSIIILLCFILLVTILALAKKTVLPKGITGEEYLLLEKISVLSKRPEVVEIFGISVNNKILYGVGQREQQPESEGPHGTDLWALDTKTGQEKRLTTGLKVIEAAWSPREEILAYVDRQTGLWLVDLDSNYKSPLNGGDDIIFDLSWKPDGTKIAYTYSQSYVHVIDIATNLRQNLTEIRWHGFSPIWSPDGTSIIFKARASGVSALWKMDEDGSNVIQLARLGSGFIPKAGWVRLWIGKRVVYDSGKSIWIMNDDGSNAGVLTINGSSPRRLKADSDIVYYKNSLGDFKILNLN